MTTATKAPTTIHDVLRVKDNLCRKYPFACSENIIFLVGRKTLQELHQSPDRYRIFDISLTKSMLDSDMIITIDIDLLMAVIK